MANLIQAPKGTKDVLPKDIYKWHYIEELLRDVAHSFGFCEIRFPTFEHTELFERGVGDTTDVVQKEMYTFTDKGGRSITLRPEGTASVVRAVVENGLDKAAMPLKVYYIAPNFRYEKPQAGRLREHHQFGVEYFGAKNPTADAEVIALADTYLKRLGIKNITAKINSIGCPLCREGYYKALIEYLEGYKTSLCATCQARMDKNPMRVLDCKSEICKGIAKNAPKTIEHLCSECSEHFEAVKLYLSQMGIDYMVDPFIVRGLDYYTKTVFEFVSNDIGAQGTVCGGGRYDGLVEALGGDAICGLGFGSGIERLLMVLEALNIEISEQKGKSIYIATIGECAEQKALCLAIELRRAGIFADFDTTGRGLKAQMKYADKTAADFVMVLGDNEIAENTAVIKDMQTGDTKNVDLSAEQIIKAVQTI